MTSERWTVRILIVFFTCVSGGSVLGNPLYQNEVLSRGPIAYFRLGESNGATASDISGNGNNGSYTGGVVLGQPGAIVADLDTSVGFNGSNAHVTGAISGFGGDAAVTILSWFRQPTASGHPGRGIAGVGTVGTGTQFFQRLSNRGPNPSASDAQIWQGGSVLGGDGENRLWIGADDGGLDRWWGSNTVIQPNTWYFAATTYDPLTHNVQIFIDGQLDRTITLSNGLALTNPLFIGGDDYNDNFFSGSIDEVSIFNKVLSSADLLALYRAGSTVPEPTSFATLAIGLVLISARCFSLKTH